MSDHTPGPWRIQKTHVGEVPSIMANKHDIVVYDIHSNGVLEGDEELANARLIAAAPEMYELLQRLQHICKEPFSLWAELAKLLKKIDGDDNE